MLSGARNASWAIPVAVQMTGRFEGLHTELMRMVGGDLSGHAGAAGTRGCREERSFDKERTQFKGKKDGAFSPYLVSQVRRKAFYREMTKTRTFFHPGGRIHQGSVNYSLAMSFPLLVFFPPGDMIPNRQGLSRGRTKPSGEPP